MSRVGGKQAIRWERGVLGGVVAQHHPKQLGVEERGPLRNNIELLCALKPPSYFSKSFLFFIDILLCNIIVI